MYIIYEQCLFTKAEDDGEDMVGDVEDKADIGRLVVMLYPHGDSIQEDHDEDRYLKPS